METDHKNRNILNLCWKIFWLIVYKRAYVTLVCEALPPSVYAAEYALAAYLRFPDAKNTILV